MSKDEWMGILQAIEEQMTWKTIIFTFCLLQPRPRDQISAKTLLTVKVSF